MNRMEGGKTSPLEVFPSRETNTKPDVSVVVSMYNSKPETLEVIRGLFLPSLLRNVTSKTQVVIVDDGSPLYNETTSMIKGFESELKRKAGDVVYKRLEQNQGFGVAYNTGIERTDGQVIMIVNDDIYLPQGSVNSLVEVLKLDSKTGAVGPVIDSSWSFQGISLFGRIKDLSREQLQRIEDFSIWLRKVMAGENYKLKGSREILLGCSLAFKREVLDRVGYLDERYKYGLFEDADWERRVRLAGYDLVLDAATFVEHGGHKGGSISLRQHPEKHMKAIITNAIKYGKKWDCLGVLPIDLTKAMLQSKGVMSIQGEIVQTAKQKGLWDEYLRNRN